MKNNYKISYLSLFIFILQGFPLLMNGQVTTFDKIYPTTVQIQQSGKDVLPTSDGGYIIVATTENNIVNDTDVRIMKTDSVGNTLWIKTYGGSKPEYPNCILKSNDGNYFIVGFSQSYGGGDQDIYLIKINPSGDLIWSKTYGGPGNEDGQEILATDDGNYVINSTSNSLNLANTDMELIKIDTAGVMIWTKNYGYPTTYESCRSVRKCLDGGFILAGKTAPGINSVSKMYLVKTNSLGDTVWTKTYGGPDSYEGKFILANTDGSYTIGMDDSSGTRDSDVRIMKIDASGTILWNNKSYGGNLKDICKMIQPTSDGGYIVGAISRSFGWINPQMWLLKLDASGDTTWTRHFGSAYHNHCYSARQTPDGGYIAVGHSRNAVDDWQVMLVKINSSGNFEPQVVPTYMEELALNNIINFYPNPSNGIVKIDLSGDLTASILKIQNAMGQEVFSQTINTSNQVDSRSIDLNGKEPGIYFLTIQSATNLTTKKLILE